MRKLFFQLGFQFNYGEPFALSNFYNATYFQNIFNSRDLKGERASTQMNSNNAVTGRNDNQTQSFEHINGGRMESRSFGEGTDELVGSDLTAAQLYESIEDNFME